MGEHFRYLNYTKIILYLLLNRSGVRDRLTKLGAGYRLYKTYRYIPSNFKYYVLHVFLLISLILIAVYIVYINYIFAIYTQPIILPSTYTLYRHLIMILRLEYIN